MRSFNPLPLKSDTQNDSTGDQSADAARIAQEKIETLLDKPSLTVRVLKVAVRVTQEVCAAALFGVVAATAMNMMQRRADRKPTIGA
jgi:hypothetical protein